LKIDVHNHFIPRDCFDMTDKAGVKYGESIVKDHLGRELLVGFGQRLEPPVAQQIYDPQRRIEDMDRIGLDMQVISIAPSFHYSIGADAALSFTRRENDGIAKVVATYPDRFTGMATVPMQDIGKAIKELERAVHELGMRAVEINSHINGRNLGEQEFWPFYEYVQALDIPIFVHPHHVAGAERMQKFFLTNLIGNPLETSLAIVSLIFEGVLEKFPRLKLIFAHAGGNIPYIRGRIEHGYQVVPECHKAIPKPPSEYLKLMYFDTIAHSTPALSYLIDTVGADRVILGSDYPFPMGDPDPIQSVRRLTGLSPLSEEKILGNTAADLFRVHGGASPG